METILQQIVNGIQQGAVYALIAVGYTMVYGVLKMINFAHGDVYMVGAYVSFFSVLLLLGNSSTPAPFYIILLILLLSGVVCALIGYLIERFAYRPLRNASRLAVLITAIGVSFLLQNLALRIFGADVKFIPPLLPQGGFKIGPLMFSTGQGLLFLTTIVLMVALRFLVLKTKFGRAMRAVSQDRQAASLMGVNVDQVISWTFILGAFLAGVGGAMSAAFMTVNITPYFGLFPGVKAFIAAVLGGIGNIPGAVLGGLVMGMAEGVVGGIPGLSDYRDAIAFLILIIVLIFKPSGILGKPTVEKV